MRFFKNKKIIVLALMLVLALTSCSGLHNPNTNLNLNTNTNPNPNPASAPEPTPPFSNETESGGKIPLPQIPAAETEQADITANANLAEPGLTLGLDETLVTDDSIAAKIGDKSPVSRALAAKMLTLAFTDLNSINNLEREINFSDCDSSKWYDKYVNAASVYGMMSGTGFEFMPEQPLLVYQAQILLDKFNPDNKIKMKITDENREKPISYMLWTDLFIQLLKSLSENGDIYEAFGITETSVIPLATPETNDRLTGYNMITDTGALSYGGYVMEGFVDQAVRILKKDSEVLAVLSVDNTEPVIKNAYVVSCEPEKITIFTGGAERTYSGANLNVPEGIAADVKISGDIVLEVTAYSETASGVLKRSSTDIIELENNLFYNVDETFKIYSVADGSIKWKTLSSIVVGADSTEFIICDGVAKAAIIKKSVSPNKIRVSLHTTNFAGLVHKSAEFTSKESFTVKYGDTTKNFSAGEIFKVDSSMFSDTCKRLYINSDNGGKIIINSIKRNWTDGEAPSYRGSIEVAIENDGAGYSIVNELSIEQYLYAVVPSEMPTSHGAEAAKVQAVTARSYAYTQFLANRYHKYGGNVDDSVSCQVYNNIPENSVSIQAVDDTRGQCLTYNGSVIAANFFSTSSGMTANSGEVWAGGSSMQFPAQTTKYLQSGKQWTGSADYGDLSKEENAEVFFKSTDVQGFDRQFSWFRWNVTMTSKEIAASINSALKARYTANPRLIKTLQPNGAYLSRQIESIGELIDIEILMRGEGGNIMQMKITGSDATILVLTEYNIRALISPAKKSDSASPIILNRIDGSKLENYSLMPSSFFVIDKAYNENQLESVTFYGGGNGHGVGMSQNGVKGMIDAGYSFDQILKHYYNGTEIETKIFY